MGKKAIRATVISIFEFESSRSMESKDGTKHTGTSMRNQGWTLNNNINVRKANWRDLGKQTEPLSKCNQIAFVTSET